MVAVDELLPPAGGTGLRQLVSVSNSKLFWHWRLFMPRLANLGNCASEVSAATAVRVLAGLPVCGAIKL